MTSLRRRGQRWRKTLGSTQQRERANLSRRLNSQQWTRRPAAGCEASPPDLELHGGLRREARQLEREMVIFDPHAQDDSELHRAVSKPPRRRPGGRPARGRGSRAGLSKPTGPVKPVAVYRTGLIRKRWKSVKFKIACSTGSERFTGRFDRFTGRFDW